ncbi:MAG: SGNH/GDSL hydrolase family protein [Bacteroidales bacterium]|nr:SGNH/GDSL hydrolase family protein [Bacteroidales bacterium]
MKKLIVFVLKYSTYLILLAILIQLLIYCLVGLKHITIASSLIFYLGLWLIVKFIIILFAKNKQPLRSNLILINSSVFFTLIIIEVALRISGLYSTYFEKRTYYYNSMYENKNADFFIKGRENSTELSFGREYSFTRTPNKEGFSDKEWTTEKDDSCYRIIAIGDSFTEGDGTDADSTWLKFLERKMSNEYVEYFNAGLCGSDPVFEYYILENTLIKYKPDLVILCINPSDIEDIIIRGGFERFQDEEIVFRKGPWWEFIYASSHVSRAFYNVFFDDKLLPKSNPKLENENSLRIIQNCLLKFNNFCKINNCEFVCVFHPFKTDLIKNKNAFKNTMYFCNKNSISYINLYEYFQKQKVKTDINQYYWQKDGHHNAKGYELMADGILKGLTEEHLPPTP